MTYRNDDDAAFARADALQQDLDDTRDELAAAQAELAALHRDPTPAAPEDPDLAPAGYDPGLWLALLILGVVFLLALTKACAGTSG